MSTQHIHMIGICGTGMGSLARLLTQSGYRVTGSDMNVYPPMSTQLMDMGITLMNGYDATHLAERPDLVIVGNVAKKDNPEVLRAMVEGIAYLSMPQAIYRFFLGGKHPIVVAGTHGKTTTSALMAWLLEYSGFNPSFMIGGLCKNFQQTARLADGPYFVLEGDEYSTAFFDPGPKFLHYAPQSLLLNAIEFDHADIYKDLNHVLESFRQLLGILPANAHLMACADNENGVSLLKDATCEHIHTFGITSDAHYRALKILFTEKGTNFQLITPQGDYFFESPLSGHHNLQNTLGVLGLLLELGLPVESLQEGLVRFEGVRRRQEVVAVVNGITIMDDFAHHPTAVSKTIEAIRSRYPAARLWAIFEPRSNTSRRRIFQREFVEAFALADRVVMAAVYQPDSIPESERFEPAQLVADIQRKGREACYLDSTQSIVEHLATHVSTGDVLLIMSNGGFDNIHQKLVSRLQKNTIKKINYDG